MTDKHLERREDLATEAAIAPWLPVLLPLACPTPPEFLDNCKESVAAAAQFARLRRHRSQLTGSLQGVSAYLRDLAAAAGAALQPVLHWAGLDLEHPVDELFGSAWGRLAHAVGLGPREALFRLRLTVADEVGQDLWPVLARTRDSAAGTLDVLAECESFLEEAAQRWDQTVRGRLLDSERALWEGYQQAEAAESKAL